MFFELLTEGPFPIAKVRDFPWVFGRFGPISLPTIYRWVEVGLLDRSGHRVKLEAAKIGGTICTTEPALKRFFAKVNTSSKKRKAVANA